MYVELPYQVRLIDVWYRYVYVIIKVNHQTIKMTKTKTIDMHQKM